MSDQHIKNTISLIERGVCTLGLIEEANTLKALRHELNSRESKLMSENYTKENNHTMYAGGIFSDPMTEDEAKQEAAAATQRTKGPVFVLKVVEVVRPKFEVDREAW